MQQSGLLRTWNDERGFGFIAPTNGGGEIFVHISEFAPNSGRPVQGEAVLYEIGVGRDGRTQALRVIRKAIGKPPKTVQPAPTPKREGSNILAKLVSAALAAAVVMAVALPVKDRITQIFLANSEAEPSHDENSDETMDERVENEAAEPKSDIARKCDGRTMCSQMTSCEEATWFINNCPGMKMDGNHDGVPCEMQHCTGAFK